MSEPKPEYKTSGQKPTVPTDTVPDEILLAMLEEVLAKLQKAGWVIAKRMATASSGRTWLSVWITGKTIDLTDKGIVKINGLPVTEVKP